MYLLVIVFICQTVLVFSQFPPFFMMDSGNQWSVFSFGIGVCGVTWGNTSHITIQGDSVINEVK